MSKTIIAAVVALLVGGIIGFFVGRWMLERSWRQPQMLLSPSEQQRLAADDADPVPPAGTKILRPMPLERARLAAKEIVKNDPVRSTVAAVGNGDEGAELHVDVVNNAKCTVTALSGVAYGFDAWGMPANVNKHGENFVAFSEDKLEIEPGKHYLVAEKLRYPDTASLVVAQIDSFSCKDGPPWKRQ
jgi:hypothetical protein